MYKLVLYSMLTTIVFLSCFAAYSQSSLRDSIQIDSLKIVLQKQKEDSTKVKILNTLSEKLDHDRATAIQYAKDAIIISRNIHYKKGEGRACLNLAIAVQGINYYGERGDFDEVVKYLGLALTIFQSIGDDHEVANCYQQLAYANVNLKRNFPEAFKNTLKALSIYEKLGDKYKMAVMYEDLGTYYSNDDNRVEQLKMLKKSLQIYEEIKDTVSIANGNIYLGKYYMLGKEYKAAINHFIKARDLFANMGNHSPDYGIPWSLGNIADAYLSQVEDSILLGPTPTISMKLEEILVILKKRLTLEANGKMSHRETYPQLGKCYFLMSKLAASNEQKIFLNESLKYYNLSLELSKSSDFKEMLSLNYKSLAEIYELLKDYKLAYESQKLYIIFRDSVAKQINEKELFRINSKYQYEKKEAASAALQAIKDAATKRTRNLQYVAITGVLIMSFFLYNNSRQKHKAKEKIEKAYTELKSTQAQLIQSEKMASLGELTAGIAHEIQNPLNFVNNFAEVSVELIEELKSERAKGKSERDDLLEEDLLNDIAQNLEKINHHGKRADGIVKGMLQHSRRSTSTKEPIEINKLADEYLRLAYHGLRSKDKSFNATLKTDFDESIGSINIIPQDIGRVILNLITNAFYVVDEKKKQGIQGYEPMVSVSTKKVADKVLISVSDNGNGIPDEIKEKIFQPFFTTKPTGQGTGLGLSLSYDIVKAHGGELNMETKKGEGTKFIISLPDV